MIGPWFKFSELVPYIHFPKKKQKTTGGTKSDLNIGCPGFGFRAMAFQGGFILPCGSRGTNATPVVQGGCCCWPSLPYGDMAGRMVNGFRWLELINNWIAYIYIFIYTYVSFIIANTNIDWFSLATKIEVLFWDVKRCKCKGKCTCCLSWDACLLGCFRTDWTWSFDFSTELCYYGYTGTPLKTNMQLEHFFLEKENHPQATDFWVPC